jgi:hypothetical protein
MVGWTLTAAVLAASSTCWLCTPSHQQTRPQQPLQPTHSAMCASWRHTQPAWPALAHPLRVAACRQVGRTCTRRPFHARMQRSRQLFTCVTY